MKRKVASRKLKRNCIKCNKHFEKGDVYYKYRYVYVDYHGKIDALEFLVCPKCEYKEIQHQKRFERFREKCTHPNWARETKYGYIAGECVMQPELDYCTLCGRSIR